MTAHPKTIMGFYKHKNNKKDKEKEVLLSLPFNIPIIKVDKETTSNRFVNGFVVRRVLGLFLFSTEKEKERERKKRNV